jgi:hypothetical protein
MNGPQLPACRPQRPGGQGARALVLTPSAPETEDAEWSRADVRDTAMSLRQRWPLTAARRQQLINALHYIATAPDPWIDPRARVAAAKACIDADRLNLEEEKRNPKGPEQLEVDGSQRWDFSKMTDEDLRAFIDNGGRNTSETE